MSQQHAVRMHQWIDSMTAVASWALPQTGKPVEQCPNLAEAGGHGVLYAGRMQLLAVACILRTQCLVLACVQQNARL